MSFISFPKLVFFISVKDLRTYNQLKFPPIMIYSRRCENSNICHELWNNNYLKGIFSLTRLQSLALKTQPSSVITKAANRISSQPVMPLRTVAHACSAGFASACAAWVRQAARCP